MNSTLLFFFDVVLELLNLIQSNLFLYSNQILDQEEEDEGGVEGESEFIFLFVDDTY